MAQTLQSGGGSKMTETETETKKKKISKMPKMVVTLKTKTGQIYQKIKINDFLTSYMDICDCVKKPEMPEIECKNHHIGYEITPTLFTTEGDPVDLYDTAESGELIVGFKIEKVMYICRCDSKVTEFPEDLNILNICEDYQFRLPNLPKKLRYLNFGFLHYRIPDLPESLKVLHVRSSYIFDLEKIPKGLERLERSGNPQYYVRVPESAESMESLEIIDI